MALGLRILAPGEKSALLNDLREIVVRSQRLFSCFAFSSYFPTFIGLARKDAHFVHMYKAHDRQHRQDFLGHGR